MREATTILEHDHDLEMQLRAQHILGDTNTKHHKKNKQLVLPQTPKEDNRPAMPNEDESYRYPLPEDLEAELRSHIWSDTKHHKKMAGTKRLRGSN